MEPTIPLELSYKHRRVLMEVLNYATAILQERDPLIPELFGAIARRVKPTGWPTTGKTVYVTAFEAILVLECMGLMMIDCESIPEGKHTQQVLSELVPVFDRGISAGDPPQPRLPSEN